MKSPKSDNPSFFIGVLCSLVAHILGAVIAIIMLESAAANASKPQEIFSVTLEGGEVLGGFTQVPKEGEHKKPSPLAPIPEGEELPKEVDRDAKDSVNKEVASEEENTKKVEPVDEETAKRVETEEQKKLTEPSIVDDPAKIAAAEKEAERKLLEEKKKKADEVKKKKAEDDKKKKAEDDKKKAELDKKKKEDEKKKKIEDEKKAEAKKKKDDELSKKARDARLTGIANKLKSTYEGESADAGGSSFGAARLGGKGMGGGTLAPAEKIAYAALLQRHVKSGWHWLPGSKQLRAQVLMRLAPTGQIQDARIEHSSGNSNFDDSVIRAVRKADPVPPPPVAFAADFAVVRFWFDSHEN